MKTQTDDFIAKEESFQRQPAELYHIWRGSLHYRYTSGDTVVFYDGEAFTPAPIERGKVSYDEKLDSNTLTIQMSRVTTPALSFVAVTPTDLVWVSVHKLHRDSLIEETTPIFIGQIDDVSFRGTTAQIKCVGFEYFLKQVVPRYRYGSGCQHTLYDNRCKVVAADFSARAEIESISENKLSITSSVFAEQFDGYYSLGFLTFDFHKRMITSHIGNTIGLRYSIPSLAKGDVVTVYAGCDKTRATCEIKFNNLDNNLSFSDIPVDNPALW